MLGWGQDETMLCGQGGGGPGCCVDRAVVGLGLLRWLQLSWAVQAARAPWGGRGGRGYITGHSVRAEDPQCCRTGYCDLVAFVQRKPPASCLLAMHTG